MSLKEARRRINLAKSKRFEYRELDLSNLNLLSVPKEIFEIGWITEINLSGNKIKILSKNFDRLKGLKKLRLNKNRIEVFPISICELRNLVYLDLSQNAISKIPKNIEKLINLYWLDLSFNKIPELPTEIGSLKKLYLLNLKNNSLSYLPSSIADLYRLVFFILINNRLIDLPRFLFEMRGIRKIDCVSINESNQNNELNKVFLGGNPIESPPLEILNQGKIAVQNYFSEIKRNEEETEEVFEAKLLIVGEPGAGKTTLAKKILFHDYDLDKQEKSTEGIEIFKYNFLIEPTKNFTVNIWDFGGQEIYHSTHQFFLTKRSLYVLLSDSRAQDTDFNYWLQVIELLSDQSPVLIVQNEKQDRIQIINELGLRGRFRNLVKVLQTNLKSNRGLEEVIYEIQHEIKLLPHIGSKLPKSWVDIRLELIELADLNFYYIEIQDYFEICERHGLNEEKALFLSSYLHDLGVFLHFSNNVILKNLVILRTDWATLAVYKLLDSAQISLQKGIFSKEDLKYIWYEKKFQNMFDELLELMMSFELIFNVSGLNDRFILPQLLPSNQPDYLWKNNNNLTVIYDYEFMPKGIMTRFIVRRNSLIKNKDWVWKEGVVLKMGESEAEILETYGRKKITIRVKGIEKEKLLTIILDEFDRIHNSYKNIIVHKYIPCKCIECTRTKKNHFYKYGLIQKYFLKNRENITCELSLEEISVATLLKGYDTLYLPPIFEPGA